MKKTFKCKNGHKFKSSEETPLCPTCNETSELVKWNKVEPYVEKEQNSKGFLNTIVNTTITAGILTGLDSTSSSPAEDNNNDSDFKSGGGKFGGGGSSGSY